MSRPSSKSPQPPPDSGWGDALGSLSIPAFRSTFVSNLAFFMAMGGQGIVRPWIAFELTDSTFALGQVSAAMAVPMLLLGAYGGVLADRVERRGLIAWAQVVTLLTEAVILALWVTERIEFWHLLVSAASIGCCLPLMMPARTAIIAAIVGRARLGAAMGLNMTAVNLTRVLGPALAGYLIALADVSGAYGFNLALYVVALATLMSLPRLPPAGNAKEGSVASNLVEGFRYVARDRHVGVVLLFGLVPQFLAMPFLSILPAFAKGVWNVGPEGFGTLNAATGIGAVIGSFYVAGRRQDRPRLPMMMGAMIAFGALLVGFSISPSFWVAVPLVLLANVGMAVFQTLNNVALQLIVRDEMRGRVSSFLLMSVSLPMLGALPMGWVADHLGPRIAVAGAASTAIVIAIAFYLLSPSLRGLDRHVRTALGRDE